MDQKSSPALFVLLSSRAHVAAIPQDVAKVLACLVLRTALQRAVPSAAIEEYRGDMRFGTWGFSSHFVIAQDGSSMATVLLP